MLKNLPLIVVLCFAISLPPRLARAVEPATVAAVASLTSSIISLFDSGSSVMATEVSQIRTMLEALHQRLDGYDKAFATILKKLDDLPQIIRTELEHALDRDQAHALLAAIKLIVEDVRIIEGGEKPIADPMSRLTALQQASRNMMQRNDLNLPYIIAALETERAFIKAIGVSEGRKIADWEIRKETYQHRLKEVFEVHNGSKPILVKRADELKQQLDERVAQLRREFAALPDTVPCTPGVVEAHEIREHRVVCRCWEWGGGGWGGMPRHPSETKAITTFKSRCPVVTTCSPNEPAKKLAGKLQQVKKPDSAIPLQEDLMLLYRYMVDSAKYSWSLLSDTLRPSYPKRPSVGPYTKIFDEIFIEVLLSAERYIKKGSTISSECSRAIEAEKAYRENFCSDGLGLCPPWSR